MKFGESVCVEGYVNFSTTYPKTTHTVTIAARTQQSISPLTAEYIHTTGNALIHKGTSCIPAFSSLFSLTHTHTHTYAHCTQTLAQAEKKTQSLQPAFQQKAVNLIRAP